MEVAELMEYSLDTVRVNLEKAKFALYKNLEYILTHQ